jgi:hypothetical protein
MQCLLHGFLGAPRRLNFKTAQASADLVDPVLQILCDNHYLHPLTLPPQTVGRPQTWPRFEINPMSEMISGWFGDSRSVEITPQQAVPFGVYIRKPG